MTTAQTYAARVRELENEGLSTSDAQGAADAEALAGREFAFDPVHPLDTVFWHRGRGKKW